MTGNEQSLYKGYTSRQLTYTNNLGHYNGMFSDYKLTHLLLEVEGKVIPSLQSSNRITNMKQINFSTYTIQPSLSPELSVRNNREDLIRQIVEKTDTKNKKYLARRIAITANTFKWSDMDLHFLLQRYGNVKNYSAFVNWSLKVDNQT